MRKEPITTPSSTRLQPTKVGGMLRAVMQTGYIFRGDTCTQKNDNKNDVTTFARYCKRLRAKTAVYSIIGREVRHHNYVHVQRVECGEPCERRLSRTVL